jgi:ribosomal protein L7/L12
MSSSYRSKAYTPKSKPKFIQQNSNLTILEIQFQNKNIRDELQINNIAPIQLHITDIKGGNTEQFKDKSYPKGSFMGILKDPENDRMKKKSFLTGRSRPLCLIFKVLR